MRSLVLASTLTAGLLAAGAPHATAGGGSTYDGGCGLTTMSVPTLTGDTYTGVLTDRTILYSTATPAKNPVSATVTCELKVNGVVLQSETDHGTVVVAGTYATSYVAHPGDIVSVCTNVTYDNGDPEDHCLWHETTRIPPQEVTNLLDYAFATTDGAACPALAARAPGVPGFLDIDGTGDTYLVAGGEPTLLWDCPPYQG